MSVMEISVVPLGTETPSVSEYIADVIKMLEEENIAYELTAMGTIIEDESTDRLFDIAKKMHKVPFNKEIKRVVTSIKIDDRKDKTLTIREKKDSVWRKKIIKE